MTAPMRLSPDPSVALVAYRFPSESKPGTFHDVALMLGEAGAECPRTFARHVETLKGGRITCWSCFAVLRYWECTCWPFLKHSNCGHIAAARKLYSAERRTERARDA